MSDVCVLLVGSTFRAEFREARAALERLCRVVPAIDVAAAVAAIETGRAVPDLIVVAQAFPGPVLAASGRRAFAAWRPWRR